MQKVDSWQQRHKLPGFVFALVKKYGDDEATYLGALITYYGFLSLFPLLIVLVSVLTLAGSSEVTTKAIGSVAHYFPVAGQDLQNNVHSLRHSGWKLIIAVLITLYGARGIADILRRSVYKLWQVPKSKWFGFPKNVINSLAIIIFGGLGFIIADLLSTYVAALNASFVFWLLANLLSGGVIFGALFIIFRLCCSKRYAGRKTVVYSSLFGAIGIQILHGIGGYIITHELKHLSLLYGVFAIVLGMLFWIYLQAQVLLYALEFGSVTSKKLWPRSITGKQPTAADDKMVKSTAATDK